MRKLSDVIDIEGAKNDFSSFKQRFKDSFSIPKKSIFGILIDGIFSLGLILLVAFTFSSSLSSKRDAFCLKIGEIADRSDNGMVYSEAKFAQEEGAAVDSAKYIAMQRTLVTAEYNRCFSFMASRNGNDLKRSKVEVRGSVSQSSEDFLITTVSAFSNSKKMECLNIELLKDISNENYFLSGTNGEVYIPDFYANEIIEGGNQYASYDEIINKECCLIVPENSINYSYRVANIFHVNGFKYATKNESYNSTDKNSGKILQSFFGNFLIIVQEGQQKYLSNCETSLWFCTPRAEFVNKEVFSAIGSSISKGALITNHFSIEKGNIAKQTLGESLSAIYYKTSLPNVAGINGIGCSILVVVFPFAIRRAFVLFKKRSKQLSLTFYPILLSSIYMLISTIVVSVASFYMPFKILTFFNIYASICYLIILFYFVFSQLASKENDNEIYVRK
jgi:hypothetical protein